MDVRFGNKMGSKQLVKIRSNFGKKYGRNYLFKIEVRVNFLFAETFENVFTRYDIIR